MKLLIDASPAVMTCYQSPPSAIPGVEHVGRAFLVVAGCPIPGVEAVVLVEAVGVSARLECPQPQAARSLALCQRDQIAADPLTGERWLDVELVDPIVIENSHADQRTVTGLGDPELSVRNDPSGDPASRFPIRVSHQRDRWEGALTSAQVELGNRLGITVDSSPEPEAHEPMMPHGETARQRRTPAVHARAAVPQIVQRSSGTALDARIHSPAWHQPTTESSRQSARPVGAGVNAAPLAPVERRPRWRSRVCPAGSGPSGDRARRKACGRRGALGRRSGGCIGSTSCKFGEISSGRCCIARRFGGRLRRTRGRDMRGRLPGQSSTRPRNGFVSRSKPTRRSSRCGCGRCGEVGYADRKSILMSLSASSARGFQVRLTFQRTNYRPSELAQRIVNRLVLHQRSRRMILAMSSKPIRRRAVNRSPSSSALRASVSSLASRSRSLRTVL